MPPSPPQQNDSEMRLSTLVEMTRLFNSSLDLNTVLNRVMESVKTVMNAEASSLLLVDKETGDLIWTSATGQVGEQVLETKRLAKGIGIAGWAVDHQESLLIEDAYNDSRFNPAMDKKTGFRTCSVICVPFIVRGEVIGVAQAINKKGAEGPSVFTQDDLLFFQHLCDGGAIAIQNAMLHQELLKQDRQKRDLEVAKSIQQSFLPEAPKDLEGYSVAMLNRSAYQVGGDFYEFFPIGGGDYFFCVGDVCGKGVSAALYMARLISDIRYIAPGLRELDAILPVLNSQLCERQYSNMFVTLLAGVLNTEMNVITLTSAGHPLPILLTGAGEARTVKTPSHPPLGLLKRIDFDLCAIRPDPGDGLLLFTDGLPEATSNEGQMLGDEGLIGLLQNRKERGAELIEALFKEIRSYCGGDSSQDDLTSLLIERV